MARALERHCGDVYCVGPLPLVSAKIAKIASRVLQGVGITYLYTHTNSISRRLGKLAQDRMRGRDCDLIFAPAGSVVLAHYSTPLPIVYLSDATQKLMVGYYPEFNGLSRSSLRVADEMERIAIKKSSHSVFPSSWAAESAVRDYGADPAAVHVVPFGANVEEWPDRSRALEGGPLDKCRMLFVGREWERKGGEIAFEALLALEQLGVDAELTVVGCTPAKGFRHPSLRVFPFLNKNNPVERAQLEELYFRSHFFLLPTRAECFSIALCEANAYGLPVLSTQTGGLLELVRDGVNGFLFPLDARGHAYASRVQEVFGSPAIYQTLRRSSREQFETRLNWDAWGRRMKAILSAAIRSPRTS
ncbi:MAG TPA: glycosyltransferase family 4 protein [Candidatus Acidoferrum sp.]|nr:glycosyltransferase family 4 protein [Candidatus Acidoferrum sp.]